MTFSPIDALLFDLGNVVIRIDFERVFARWAALAGCDAARLREKFSHDEPYQRQSAGRSRRRPTSQVCAVRSASSSRTRASSKDGMPFTSGRCLA